MKEVLEAILNNENLKEEVKVLLVKHGYYKEARDLKDYKSLTVIDLNIQDKTNWSKTDDAIYGDKEYEKKLKSLEAAKTKVIAKN